MDRECRRLLDFMETGPGGKICLKRFWHGNNRKQ
jgi:hypothetical protein